MLGIVLTFMVLLVVVIVLFWLKKALFVFGFFFKIFSLLMILCIAASILFGYYIIKDANDFKENFMESSNMILVEDSLNDGKILAGIEFNSKEQKFDPMTKEQLTFAEESYKNTDFNSINDDYYKIFVIDVESFGDVEIEEIAGEEINLTSEEIKQIMRSDNARREIAEILSAKSGESISSIESKLAASSEEIKGHLLTYYLSAVFNPSNIGQFLKQLGSDHIKVYENTALFKAIKLMPTGIISSLI
ncbi:MAG TPA: hypothetical protein VEC16_01410 [Alphaproteobacteria bacterium]|nr:hypothetical protein [Alphaproteobacteria bacterium]